MCILVIRLVCASSFGAAPFEPQSKHGKMKVRQGQSQPEIVADICLCIS